MAISIADNAYGISKEFLSKIFDPFFTTKPPGKGTGLGLAISYKIIVEGHGGQMQCHSSPGEGTEFVIKLPISVATVATVATDLVTDETDKLSVTSVSSVSEASGATSVSSVSEASGATSVMPEAIRCRRCQKL